MNCPRCQAANPAGARFCLSCGSQLAASRQAEGERKLVTVLFADVVGSTAMAERLDPEQVTEIMNGAFAFLNRAVAKYGGTVTRLMGDAVLALFGAPAAHEDDAERAVRVGLEIQASAKEYAQAVKGNYGLDFQVRVGINTGLAVLDVVGDRIRTEYTAMGDATNVAARMQSSAEPGTVLISWDTYRLVKNLFEFKPRGKVEVKGKSAPIEVYEVIAPKEAPGKVRGLEGLASPLVGRDAEFSILRQKIETLGKGQGAIVAVIGEAGLGKSRLIAEVRKSTNPDSGPQIVWLEGRAISYGQSISYYPWRQVIRQSIGAGESESPASVREKLKFACDCCKLPGGDVPFLEAMLAVASEESLKTVAGYEGNALTQRMTEATRGYVCAGARMMPMVIAFDDLHWADDASLELLLNVCDLVETYPLLLACLLRPDKDAPSWSFVERARGRLGARFTEIVLEPLSEGFSRELLGNLLYIEDLPGSVRNLILSKSEGNPFFVEEVIRSLIDSRHIVREDSHWRATTEIVNVAIPNTLAGVLSARIDRLPEDAKRVAQMASVIGRTFSHSALKTICLAAPENERIPILDPHLDALKYAELVRERAREPEVEYIFKHALTQEAAYNSLLIKRRKEFHRRVGEAFEGLYAERLDEFAPTLAHHFWEAEDWARAADYSMRAGAGATRVYALSEALEHYGRALEVFEKIPDPLSEKICDAILGWAQAAFKFRSYAEILERLSRAEKIARELNDKGRLAQVLHRTANVHLASGYTSRAIPALAVCFSLAEELGDERLAIMPGYYMALMNMDADPRGALAQLDRVIELAVKHKDKDMEAYARGTKGIVCARLGLFEEAQEAMGRAQEVVRGIDSPATEGDVDLFAAWSYLDMGDAEHGLEYGRRGLDKVIATDSIECVCNGYACIGFGNLQAQKLPEAMAAFEESVKRSKFSGAVHTEIIGRAGLALTQFLSGRLDAIEDMENTLANAQDMGDPYGIALLSRVLGESLVQLGQLERGESYLSAALDYYRRNDMRPYLARALGSLGHLYEKQGRIQDAQSARAEAEKLMIALH